MLWHVSIITNSHTSPLRSHSRTLGVFPKVIRPYSAMLAHCRLTSQIIETDWMFQCWYQKSNLEVTSLIKVISCWKTCLYVYKHILVPMEYVIVDILSTFLTKINEMSLLKLDISTCRSIFMHQNVKIFNQLHTYWNTIIEISLFLRKN